MKAATRAAFIFPELTLVGRLARRSARATQALPSAFTDGCGAQLRLVLSWSAGSKSS